MSVTTTQSNAKRRSVNLTIRKDVIEMAKSLKLNASKAAEAGLVTAIREAQGEQWKRENHVALAAHNKRIEREGPLLTPGWAAEE